MSVNGSRRAAFFLVTGFVAALCVHHAAAQQVPRVLNPQIVRRTALGPGQVDLGASRVYVFVDKTGFGHQHAVVGRLKEGVVRLGTASAGRLVFDLNSFTADSAQARRFVGLSGEPNATEREQVTANMLGPDVLDVERYPEARLAIDSAMPGEHKPRSTVSTYRVAGKFTLHGVTRPLEFTAEGTPERGYLHLKGSFPLRQTEFKIRPFRKALGAVGVADVLTVYGDLWIRQ